MDTNGNILEYYRTIQRGHLVDTAPHHRSRYPAHHAALPETDLMGKTLHENLHGISERVDIRRVLHDVLRSARTPLYTRHLLGSDCTIVAMGFVYRLHSVRAQPEIQSTGGGTLCNAFPLPAPFVGTRNGISHDDHHRDALLGSSFHHRATAGFLAQGQPARHSVPLPLGAHRLFQSLHLQDSRRPPAGKRHRTCHLSVLQELL